MSEATISKEKFEVLLERAGLQRLDDRQTEELRETYAFVEAMVKRVRTPRGFGAEPALVFALPTPDAAK